MPKKAKKAKNGHFSRFSGFLLFFGVFSPSGAPRDPSPGVDVKATPGGPRGGGPGPLGRAKRGPGRLPGRDPGKRALFGTLGLRSPATTGPAGGVLHQPLAPGPCPRAGRSGPLRGPGTRNPRNRGFSPFLALLGPPRASPGPGLRNPKKAGTGPRREGLM